MGNIISIDFGTTNTVIAEWLESLKIPETIALAGLSRKIGGGPPSIPSLLYVDDLKTGTFRAGQAILSHGLDQDAHAASRLFSGMKRALLSPELDKEQQIDGQPFKSKQAAEVFLNLICQGLLSTGRSIDEIVLTVPVMAFEVYLRWLASILQKLSVGKALPRIIDEPTAAAFGYRVNHPGGMVLVIDFGGGTLDLSIVRLPEDFEATGKGIVVTPTISPQITIAGDRARIKARVIGKTYRQIGGSDIDAELVDYWLEKEGLTKNNAKGDIPALLRLAEETKIKLCSDNEKEIENSYYLRSNKKVLDLSLSLEVFDQEILGSPKLAVLETLRGAISDILDQAEQKNIGDRNIDYVLLVGGTTLIPAISDLVINRFGKDRVLQPKPFEAVAHGALYLTQSHPIEDFLQHSYALEAKSVLGSNPPTSEYVYLPIILAGSAYPFEEWGKLGYFLTPPFDNSSSVDIILAEIDEKLSPGQRIVLDTNGRILQERGKSQVPRAQTIHILRKHSLLLKPPGTINQVSRLDVSYIVDENRTLRLTVYDNVAHLYLMRDEPITRLE